MKNMLLILTLCFAANPGFTQCKYKGIPKQFLKFSISEDRPKPDKATKPKVFFDKLDFVARVSAVKSGQKKYFYFHYARSTSKRFDINTDDPIEFTTDSGKKVSLQPSGNYQGKKVLTTYIIGVFYEVTDDQLLILAADPVEGLKLNVTAEKEITGGINVDAGGWNTGPKGDSYYTTKINSKSNRDKLKAMAKCLKAI